MFGYFWEADVNMVDENVNSAKFNARNQNQIFSPATLPYNVSVSS